MEEFYVQIGETAAFSKTIGEYDVYQFAGLTGDFSANHVNEAEMRKSAYGKRIAHGALLVGFMSTTSTAVADRSRRPDASETPVSLGYDKIRFIGPVYLGDTITVEYTVSKIDLQKRRSTADVKVTTDRGELVAVAQHILKWVANDARIEKGLLE